jgi:hypothetical protein
MHHMLIISNQPVSVSGRINAIASGPVAQLD